MDRYRGAQSPQSKITSGNQTGKGVQPGGGDRGTPLRKVMRNNQNKQRQKVQNIKVVWYYSHKTELVNFMSSLFSFPGLSGYNVDLDRFFMGHSYACIFRILRPLFPETIDVENGAKCAGFLLSEKSFKNHKFFCFQIS